MANKTQAAQLMENEPFNKIDQADEASNRVIKMEPISDEEEYVVTVSPETVFMCKNFESEMAEEREHSYIKSRASKKTEKPQHQMLLITDVRSLAGNQVENCETGSESLPSIQCDGKVHSRAIITVERCVFPSTNEGEEPESLSEALETVQDEKVRLETAKKLAKAEYMRKQRASQTPEEREKRLQYHAEYKRKERESEKPEEREKRLKYLAEYKKKHRTKRRKYLAEYRKKKQAEETLEEREERLKCHAEEMKIHLERKTPEERDRCRKVAAEARRMKRANETPAEREKRLLIANESQKLRRERKKQLSSE